MIAEGIETPEQLLELRALGSELGQGFYFGVPMSDDVRRVTRPGSRPIRA